MNKKNGQYEALALAILKKVGGPQNISSVTHCMTRLRFNLKDSNIPNDDEVKKISGVLGVARSGGQYQVVIGQTVSDVYAALLDVSK
ncbi:PTS transporter subunit EIIB [Pediococcus ethanolidurans]